MPASTACGGGAAAVKKRAVRFSGLFSDSLALSSVYMTMGAPQRCVTPCSAISS
jgi:hypothetical protein